MSEQDGLTMAAVQMASGPNVAANLLEAGHQIEQAARDGAQLVVLPENFAFMGASCCEALEKVESDGCGPIQDFLADQARRHDLYLVGGTVPLEARDPGKVRSACLLYDPSGARVARYDKMHLFDVDLVDADETYRESSAIEPGDEVVVVDTPWGCLGLAVCYDLRFPELFRAMLDLGMELLAVPAAFTAVTGQAHWDTLVRARAVENLCYVVAAAQGGYHISSRQTHGHSMVVDPWGSVMGELGSGNGVVLAEVDRARLESIRTNFPAISHRRLHCSL